ncbi:hypothetical protein QJS10_CPA05g00974 [Acorus calamus]|uniref:phosphoribosylglycinamide formyltransferase 1 n=1 Tax=Acorus calamus TaxID=4465 RepID=A0AAV9ESH6_ACOCL|nr:hypothetical protein QJS10_CPA05g00974 [Acorus calamus]
MEVQRLDFRVPSLSSLFRPLNRPQKAPILIIKSPSFSLPRSIDAKSASKSSLKSPQFKGFQCRRSFGRTDEDGVSGLEGRSTKKRLAVFVSGGGSNFQSVHEATLQGSVFGVVVVLVTNKPDCGGAKYARNNGIPVALYPKISSTPEGLSSVDLVDYLAYSGPTVHFVDEHYDTGRILAQRVVPVLATDAPEELASRVLHEEHKLYVEATSALCDGRITWREDGVPLIQSKENPDIYS